MKKLIAALSAAILMPCIQIDAQLLKSSPTDNLLGRRPMTVENAKAVKLVASANGFKANNSTYGTENGPDAELETYLPSASPMLTNEENVSVFVINYGTDDIKSVKLTYYVDEGEGVEQHFEFDTSIPGDGNYQLVTFDKKADFSVDGTHTVRVVATDVKSSGGYEETGNALANNETLGTVIKMTQQAKTPFFTDFTNGMVPENWESEEFEAWWYNPSVYAVEGSSDTSIFYSCGVSLKANTSYKFIMNYIAGFYYDYDTSCHFSVRYGKTGTDVSTWETIVDLSDLLFEEFRTESFEFTTTESGSYQFAIVPDEYDGNVWLVAFQSLSVEEIAEKDVRVIGIDGPTIVPEAQADKFNVSVTFLNNGTQKTDFDLTLEIDGQTIGQNTLKGVPSGAQGETGFAVQLPNAAVGYKTNMKAIPSIEGAEEAVLVSVERPFEVHSTTLAYDNTTEKHLNPDYAIGSGYPIGCGAPFSIAKDDVITGMTIGWANIYEIPATLRIYEYNPGSENLGNLLIEEEVEVANEIGWATYPLNPRMLPAGDYLAMVVFQSWLLGCDSEKTGKILILDPNTNEYSVESGFGHAAIRLEFGEGSPIGDDLAVKEITKPDLVGVFSANETVEAIIENLGSYDNTGIATLTVDGQLVDSKDVDVAAYSKATVSFVADLSGVGTHTIEVSIAAAIDERADNNILTKTVKTKQAGSPYELDFEECESFTQSNFVPAWTTYDGDKAYTYGLDAATFPGAYEQMSFLVFNPSETSPATDNHPEIAAYQGNKYGVSFAAAPSYGVAPPNDDWLISPKLLMPTNEEASISFVAKAISDSYPEDFEVLVSETDNNPESFAVVQERTTVMGDWTPFTVSLNQYAGKEIHIAIRYVSTDMLAFMIDNIEVSQPSLSGIDSATIVTPEVVIYPNPAVEAINVKSNTEIESIAIFSASGANVYSNNSVNNASFRYNVTALASGIYFARIQTASGTTVERFIVK